MVISGPSGAGKTTIAHAVCERFDGIFSISATTRPQSRQERDGVDYYFLDERRFLQMVEAGEFIEHARVFGQYFYGTLRKPVEESLNASRVVILDIDVQGGVQVREAMPATLMLFILPPGDEVLLDRLRARRRDSEQAIKRRFAEAKEEIALAESSGAYDAFIVNDDLQRAKAEAWQHVENRLRDA